MKYLIINKNRNGSYTIKDEITFNIVTYYGYSLNNAIKEHRKNNGLSYKHFTKIILEG